jgi:hypothetical protein
VRLEEQMQQRAEPPPRVIAGRGRLAKLSGPNINNAYRLLMTGHVDLAIQELYLVRRHSPRSPEAALLLGHAYFKKLWRTDGLREYDTAIKLSPVLRHNPHLVHNTVSALDDYRTYRLARAVIKARIGVTALPEVRRYARARHVDPRTRARCVRLAEQLARAARRR